jgi:hypothetical protein
VTPTAGARLTERTPPGADRPGCRADGLRHRPAMSSHGPPPLKGYEPLLASRLKECSDSIVVHCSRVPDDLAERGGRPD